MKPPPPPPQGRAAPLDGRLDRWLLVESLSNLPGLPQPWGSPLCHLPHVLPSLTFSSTPIPGGTPVVSYPAPIVWQETVRRSNPVLSAISRENSLILRVQCGMQATPILPSFILLLLSLLQTTSGLKDSPGSRETWFCSHMPSRIHTRRQRPFSLYHTLPQKWPRVDPLILHVNPTRWGWEC